MLLDILEASYFVFFLPLSSYDKHQIVYYYKTSIFLSLVAISQLTFIHIYHFIEKKQKKYFLVYRSLGYWIEIKARNIPDIVKINEIELWSPQKSPSELKEKFYVNYAGKYYKRLSFIDAFKFGDRMIMEFIQNTQKFAVTFYSGFLVISFIQIYFAIYLYKDVSVLIQLCLSILMMLL